MLLYSYFSTTYAGTSLLMCCLFTPFLILSVKIILYLKLLCSQLMYLFELQDTIFTVTLLNQIKASTSYIPSHSVHPIHDHHPIINLYTFYIPIILTDIHSLTNYLNLGMPLPLLMYIYLSPSSISNLKNIFKIMLYQILTVRIHVLSFHYVCVTSAIILLLL